MERNTIKKFAIIIDDTDIIKKVYISESLKKHLEMAIEKLGFLTPVVVVEKDGKLIVEETAKLSPLGQTIFKEDKKQRSKWFKYFLRFFYSKN